ncbi:MAG: hypothetical protein AAB320_03745 [Elusimicrobiota bacterium]
MSWAARQTTLEISCSTPAILKRARQFFNWCLVSKTVPEHAAKVEQEIEACDPVRGLYE